MGQLAQRATNATRRFGRRAIAPRITDEAWRGQALAVAAALGLMVFMVRVLGGGWEKKFKIFFPDSFSFIKVAKQTPFSFAFYASERPVGFPTLIFLMGRSVVVTVVAQTLLYGIVYIAAVAVAMKLLARRESRVLCGFIIVLLAIEPKFAIWNTHILSESLGISLAVTTVLLWWRFSAEPSTRRLNWAGAATIGWLATRVSNVPPWAAVGVPALLLAGWLWKSADIELRKRLRIWGALTLAVCIGIGFAQASNGRDRYATINNVGTRVLTDKELTSWFVDQGMPLDAALVKRTGSDSFQNSWDMLRSPDLANFRHWADNGGQRTMLISYVRFAPHYISLLYDNLPSVLSYRMEAYDTFGVTARLPDPAPAELAGPTTPVGLLVWTILAAASLVLAFVRGRRVQAVVLGLLLLSSFADLYLAFVGDSVEVLRHMVGPLARMSLIMIVCVCIGFDALLEIVAGRPLRRRSMASDTTADATLGAADGAVEEGDGEPEAENERLTVEAVP